MSISKRIALMLDRPATWHRRILEGIIDYAQPSRHWVMTLRGPGLESLPEILDWKPDGIIAAIEDPSLAAELASRQVPVVNVADLPDDSPLPVVSDDNRAVGRAAADHFVERGLRHFAYLGSAACHASARRCEGFRAGLPADATCAVFDVPSRFCEVSGQTDASVTAEIQNWAASLPPSAGVLAYNDWLAFELASACGRINRHIPEQLAIVGVNDDPIRCALSEPRLSSIRLSGQNVGFRAASLMEKLLEGGPRPAAPERIAPRGLIVRRSSDVLAVADADLAAALHFIHDHACERISMKDVLRAVPVSRRTLEVRFQKLLGRSPLNEIHRVQVDHARRLLAETDLSIAEVADRSGFRDVNHLGRCFSKLVGMMPRLYRRETRGGDHQAA